MEHIHDLSAKLQKGDFAYLGGVFGDGLALFRFEQAVLGFTQFDTGQVAQFIAVDRNPVVFLCRDQVLFFQAPQVQVVAISHPEVAHIGPQSQFEFLCAQFLVLNLYPGIPLFAFPVETVEYVDADRHPIVEAEAALEVGRSYLVPVRRVAVSGIQFDIRIVTALDLFVVQLGNHLVLLGDQQR